MRRYIKSYFKKDGTYVNGHGRETNGKSNWGSYAPDVEPAPYTGKMPKELFNVMCVLSVTLAFLGFCYFGFFKGIGIVISFVVFFALIENYYSTELKNKEMMKQFDEQNTIVNAETDNETAEV